LIDVLNPICNDSIWDDEKVKLDDEFSLLLGIIFCVPVPECSAMSFGVRGGHLAERTLMRRRRISWTV
jgi:hypothetical protein